MGKLGELKKEYGFDAHLVKDIAEKTGKSVQTVYDVICQKNRTHSITLASAIAEITGKPTQLYLISKGVRIDPTKFDAKPPKQYLADREDWSWQRVDEQTSLTDISDLDLLQLHREVMTLAAEIAVEMQRRTT